MKRGNTKHLRFVVQRHKASHLHYDLRLEIGGILKSWALKKGPSMNPQDRRLAVLTKDHPMLYRFYRGIVPGPIWRGRKISKLGWRIVEVWDTGYYTFTECPPGINENDFALKSFDHGILKITFHGKKLKGEFTLIKTNFKKPKHYNSNKSWLLVKQQDKYATDTAYQSEWFTPRLSFINIALKREKRKLEKSLHKQGKAR